MFNRKTKNRRDEPKQKTKIEETKGKKKSQIERGIHSARAIFVKTLIF